MESYAKLGHFYREEVLNATVIAFSFQLKQPCIHTPVTHTHTNESHTLNHLQSHCFCPFCFGLVFKIKCHIVLCSITFGCRIVVVVDSTRSFYVCIRIRPILISNNTHFARCFCKFVFTARALTRSRPALYTRLWCNR